MSSVRQAHSEEIILNGTQLLKCCPGKQEKIKCLTAFFINDMLDVKERRKRGCGIGPEVNRQH